MAEFNAEAMRALKNEYREEERDVDIEARIENRIRGAALSGCTNFEFFWDINSELADYINSHHEYYEKQGFNVYSGSDCGMSEIVISWED